MICPFCNHRRAVVLLPVKRLEAPVTPGCYVCRKMPMYWLRRQLIEYGGYRSVNGVLVSLKAS